MVSKQLSVFHIFAHKKLIIMMPWVFLFNQKFDIDGQCWRYEAQGGAICFQGDRFRAVTFSGNDVFVTELFDKQHFSYKLQNTEVLHEEHDLLLAKNATFHNNRKLTAALQDSTWIDSLEGKKYACTVEEVKKFDFNVKNIRFIESLEDAEMGNITLWNFNNWYILTMDSDSNPISMQSIEDFEDISYFSEEEYVFVPIDGCDAHAEGIEFPETEEIEDYGARLLLAHSPDVDEETYFSIKQDGRRLRQLSVMTDIGRWMTGTDYCGPGTYTIWHDLDCPTDRVNRACRKHDHARKVTFHWYTAWLVPRLECKVDKNIHENARHHVVDSLYHPYGIMSDPNFGCWNYESWVQWRVCYTSWGFPYPCEKRVSGWRHKYGWWRYSNVALASSYHGGGYKGVQPEEKCRESFYYSF